MAKGKKKVFLIEDEKDIMYLNKTALGHAGFEVLAADSGKEAMEEVKRMQVGNEPLPDLVLLDLVLPDLNGLEILREIRENEKTKAIKVFILSNYTSESLLNMKYIQPDKFILKSTITPTQLVDLINEELK
jgi:DNA-binding response OmpR family regulator